MKLIGTLCLVIWLVVATTSLAQPPSNDSSPPPILDTDGQPLQRGVEYYIIAGVTDIGGGVSLVTRNGTSCPPYVGLDDDPTSPGFPVVFTPFLADETVIRESRDFTVQFSAVSICVSSLAWRVGETDAETGRRLIVTGGQSQYGGYFRINREGGVYNVAWCPTDVCPICRFQCGSAGILIEDDNVLLALDGPVALPVSFRRA
ncbi:hypothetical protein L1049_002716 [Liquidambar formosana]|uniref:Uncharacterized protein n=1 Tax=Liquidambar formosana TaxID=63359 RepID=A0AAP0NIH2_LIQFO